MCIAGCTISAEPNLEIDNLQTYLQFTIEKCRTSVKRKTAGREPPKRFFVIQSKGIGLVSNTVSADINNKLGAFFI